jgi:hypothetical protein
VVVPAENTVVLTDEAGFIHEVVLCSLDGAMGKVDLVENGEAHGVVKKCG